jgi:6-pyruvoyl-tetrahydropterin synthase
MKNTIFYALVCLVAISCQKKVAASDVTKINGYWEIQTVVFPDGQKKEYTPSTLYDYFEIKDNKGFRKKVTPQFDGTFLVDDSDEKVTLTQKDGTYTLHYLTAYAKWDEELVAISDQELVTRNNSKKEYHYKRAQPINLISDGKKNQ